MGKLKMKCHICGAESDRFIDVMITRPCEKCGCEPVFDNDQVETIIKELHAEETAELKHQAEVHEENRKSDTSPIWNFILGMIAGMVLKMIIK